MIMDTHLLTSRHEPRAVCLPSNKKAWFGSKRGCGLEGKPGVVLEAKEVWFGSKADAWAWPVLFFAGRAYPRALVMSIQVSTANDVKVYNISTGKSLPEVRPNPCPCRPFCALNCS